MAGQRSLRVGKSHSDRGEAAREDVPCEFSAFALTIWAALAVSSIVFTAGALMLPPPEQSSRLVASSVTVERRFHAASPAPVVADPVTTAAVPAKDEETPVASPLLPSVNDPVSPFGAEIGRSASVPVLSERFHAMQVHAPDLFAEIRPLIHFTETDTALEAALVAGPFLTRGHLDEFCREVKLRLTLACRIAPYEGDPLSLND